MYPVEHTGGTRDVSGSRDPRFSADDPLAALPDPEDSHAVDEQLAAILDAIRSWDWQAGIFADDGTLKRATESTGRHISKFHPAPDPLSSFSGLYVEPSLDAIRSQHPHGLEGHPASDPRPLIEDPLELPLTPRGNGANQSTRDLTNKGDPSSSPNVTPARPGWAPAVAPSASPPPFFTPPLAPRTAAFAPPALVTSPSIDVVAPAPAAVGIVEAAPEPETATGSSAGEPPPRRWWLKNVRLWLWAALIAVIVVAIMRSHSPGPAPLASNSASSSSTSTKPSVQVTSTVLAQFKTISGALDNANVAATKALTNGSTQSVAQVTSEVAPYISALEAFTFDLNLIAWPAAMQAPSQVLTLRTQYLTSYLASASSAGPAGLTSWFTRFHALAQQTQAGDNVVRRDLGLSTTSNYP